MNKASNRIWIYLAIMIGLPFLMPIILPDPWDMFAMMGISMLMLLMIRKFAFNVASSVIGSKIVWVCSACGKESKKTECSRCGSKQRRLR